MSSPQLIQNPLTPSTLSGSLSTTNPVIDYQLDLSSYSSSTASISLTSLTGDVNLQVFKGTSNSGTPIGQSANTGTLSESLLLGSQAQTLIPGIYTIEVTLGANTTSANYNLNIAVNADANFSSILWRNAPSAQAASWNINGGAIAGTALYNQLTPDWQVQGTADLNADGEDDVLWRNMNTGQVAYWLFKGGQSASSGLISTPVPLDWQIAAVKDLNGDQQADVVWYNAKAGQVAIWTLQNAQLASSSVITVGAGWKPVAVADLNGDTKGDIIFQNPLSGQIAFWQMNGTQIVAGSVLTTGATWQPILFGDLNGDGKSDIVLRDSASGALAVWLMNGINVNYGWVTSPVSLDWQASAVGNFDGGAPAGADDELLWSNSKTGELALWQFNSIGKAFSAYSYLNSSNGQKFNAGTGWTIAGISDFNGDGKDDILYRNAQQGIVKVMQMNGTTVASTQDTTGVTSNWQVQSILHRQLTATPFDISGHNSTDTFNPTTAFDLGSLNGGGTYTDSVAPNASDYFKFNVSTPSNATFGVVQSGVTLQLFQIQSNGTLGAAIALSNEMLLSSGSYVIKVSTTNQAVMPYTLTLSGRPQATDVAGASFSASPTFALNSPHTNNVVTATFQIVNNGSTTLNSVDVSFLISRDSQIAPTSSADKGLNIDSSTATQPGVTISSPSMITLTNPLAPGATSAPITVQLDLPDTADSFWYVDGNYTIGMVVDPNNKLSETNESNNFNVKLGTDKATLAITKTQTLELIGSNMQQTGGVFAPGQTIDVSFTVKDIGNRAFPDSTQLPIQFYLSSDPALDSTVDPALNIATVDGQSLNLTSYYIRPSGNSTTILGAAGSGSDSKTIQFQLTLPTTDEWTWGTGARTFYLSSWLDPNGTVPNEANTTNNKIDPATVGTPDDTLGKNYLKFTLS